MTSAGVGIIFAQVTLNIYTHRELFCVFRELLLRSVTHPALEIKAGQRGY